MFDNRPVIDEIQLKVNLLIAKLNMLQTDVLRLTLENTELKNKLLINSDSLESAKELNKNVKLADGINLSELDKAELNELINSKIKQIDSCINMLNNIG